jgi:F0F1-type ATP synthase membrane subunit c/vacuolar-type H+-ATPase subunit K
MLQSLLDQVNILIKMKVGDAYRLEHIKLMLKQKRTVYGSDRVYLDHLIDEYIEQIKTQKQLSKIRDDDPFEGDTEKIRSEENNDDESEDKIIELEHIYCWKCGKSIPVNSKFCLDCGSDIKKPQIKEEIVKETHDKISDEIIEKKSNDGNKKNILIVVGVLAILAIIGGAVVMGGTFDKTISSIGDNKSLLKENTLTVKSDPTSKCGVGTVFDDATNSCILEGTQTTSKCGVGTVFDDATNSCILEGT